MEIKYDEAKFTEMLLYVAARLQDDRAGGATKLNKVLYFADFAHVRRHGRPISGAAYQKLPHGPAPHQLKPVRARIVAKGDADLVNDDFLGYRLDRLIPRRDPDLSVFDSEELATIDKVLADLEHLTAKQVSDLSHDEPWWTIYDEGEAIPYHAALMAKEQVVTPAARRMAEAVAERYGIGAER